MRDISCRLFLVGGHVQHEEPISMDQSWPASTIKRNPSDFLHGRQTRCTVGHVGPVHSTTAQSRQTTSMFSTYLSMP